MGYPLTRIFLLNTAVMAEVAAKVYWTAKNDIFLSNFFIQFSKNVLARLSPNPYLNNKPDITILGIFWKLDKKTLFAVFYTIAATSGEILT